VIRTLLSTLSALAQPALRLWDRLPIRVQGRITVGLPLVAVFLSTCLALVGNHQRVDIETDIQRKFEMTAALGGLTTLMVNAETGMRGYLLTGQSEYVRPFDQASDELPTAMARLTELAAAEPGEKPRQDKLQRADTSAHWPTSSSATSPSRGASSTRAGATAPTPSSVSTWRTGRA
jgi:CHASE3 domain